MPTPDVCPLAARALEQAVLSNVIVAILSASVTGAAVTAASSRRSSRRSAHHAAYIELRQSANELRIAAKCWGESTFEQRHDADTALVAASARFDFARLAVPSWTVRHLAAAWKKQAFGYFGGDEDVTLDMESQAWRAFATAWGRDTQKTY